MHLRQIMNGSTVNAPMTYNYHLYSSSQCK